jgi:hypothetical protein
MVTGEVRGAFSMLSSPNSARMSWPFAPGARRTDEGGDVIDGQKTWRTNGASSNLVEAVVKTGEAPKTRT